MSDVGRGTAAGGLWRPKGPALRDPFSTPKDEELKARDVAVEQTGGALCRIGL